LACHCSSSRYRNAGEITAAASKDAWDITFMPHEAEREKLMDHGPAFVTYDSTTSSGRGSVSAARPSWTSSA
jgi:polar amino acid transport system substrate-binding protein